MKFEKTEVWGFEHAIRGLIRQDIKINARNFSLFYYTDREHNQNRY